MRTRDDRLDFLGNVLWVDGAASGPIIADGQQPEALPGNPGIYRPRDKARPQVRGLCLTPSLTASLRDRARQEATTVHGALCAALINAGRRVPLGWQDFRCGSYRPSISGGYWVLARIVAFSSAPHRACST